MTQKIILVLISSIFTINTFAQKDCFLEVNEKDRKTNKTIQLANYGSASNYYLRYQIGNNGDNAYLGLDIYDKKIDEAILNEKTDTLSVLMSNKEVIKLTISEIVKPKLPIIQIGKGDQRPQQLMFRYYNMNLEQIKTMSENKVVAFMYKVGDTNFDFDMDDMKATRLKKSCICIYNALKTN